MKTFISTSAMLVLAGGIAVAQESGTAASGTDTATVSGTGLSMGMGADLSTLPEACRSAAGTATGGSLSGATTGASDSAGTASTGTESTDTGDNAATDTSTGTGSADASADSTDPAASTDGTGTETATAGTSTETSSAGAGTDASGGMSTAMMGMHGQMMAVQGIANKDLAFACAMIPHHQGAIDMARAMEAQLTDDELKSLAITMVTSHQTEIDTLTKWVEENGATGQ